MEHAIPTTDAAEFDENLDMQPSMYSNIQEVQSPTRTPEKTSRLHDPLNYSNQDVDTTSWNLWLNADTLGEDNGAETEKQPIRSK